MSRFNFQASITIVGEQYFLSEDEINFIVDEAEEWKPEDRVPPADLCLLIYDVIHHKYQDELEENSKKKLAASILKMSYFQYSDIVFTEKRRRSELKNKRGRSTPITTKLDKVVLSLQMERDRQDAEARSGMKISREEFLEAQKSKKIREQRAAKYKNISNTRLKEVISILEEYKSTARDAVEIKTLSNVPTKIK